MNINDFETQIEKNSGLKEELRIGVEVSSQMFEETIYEYDLRIVQLSTFICLLQRGTPQLTEHISVKGLNLSELHTLEQAPADLLADEKLMKEGLK